MILFFLKLRYSVESKIKLKKCKNTKIPRWNLVEWTSNSSNLVEIDQIQEI